MTPKDVSIRVGNVTLSTANVPKDGIDLTKLSGDTQQLLSIFDTNGDKKLSRAEIENGIMKLAAADKTHSEENGDQIITTKKNGVLEDIELESLKLKVDWSKIELDHINECEVTAHEKKALLKEIKSHLKEFAEKMGISIDEARKQISEIEVDIDKSLYEIQKMKRNKRTADSYEIKGAAKELQKQMVAENEIKKNGLQRTYNENWLKDAKGNHYKFNEQTMKFEKVNNVDYVAKDGSYRTHIKNKKGQQVLRTYSEPAEKNEIKVLNYENKAYIKPDYAAKLAGLTKWGNGYQNKSDGCLFKWDSEKHVFRGCNELREESFIY